MGLIDADELKAGLYKQWFMDILLTQRNSQDMFYALAQKIDEQPTAYDVDKVVKQLESESARWQDSGDAYNDEKEKGVAIGFRKAIEIVKRGGTKN